AARAVDDGGLVAEAMSLPEDVLRDRDPGHRDVGAAALDDHGDVPPSQGEPLIARRLSPPLGGRQAVAGRRPPQISVRPRPIPYMMMPVWFWPPVHLRPESFSDRATPPPLPHGGTRPRYRGRLAGPRHAPERIHLPCRSTRSTFTLTS